jgi:hypothetical protein
LKQLEADLAKGQMEAGNYFGKVLPERPHKPLTAQAKNKTKQAKMEQAFESLFAGAEEEQEEEEEFEAPRRPPVSMQIVSIPQPSSTPIPNYPLP